MSVHLHKPLERQNDKEIKADCLEIRTGGKTEVGK